tara:strand:+ start:320 stop:787 length:468 start_codon:yes stop_codon:yes gene_type:complete
MPTGNTQLAQEPYVRDRQDRFLDSYSILGSIRSATEVAGLGRRIVHGWISEDKYGFKERFEESKHNFRESLQDLAVERVKEQGAKDNPVLLITLLNAHWGEKYRPQTSNAQEEAKDVLLEMKKSFQRSLKPTETIIDVTESVEEKVEKILENKKK